MEPERLQERNYRESDFAEEKKLLRLMRERSDDTKKLISDAIKSDSAPISCKDARKEKGKKDVVKSATVMAAYAGDSLGGVELFVNTLNSGAKWHVRVSKQFCKQGNRLILWGVCTPRHFIFLIFFHFFFLKKT